MVDRTGPQPVGAPDPGAPGRIVFTIAGESFALPMAAVEAVAPPPPLARVPHAAPALLGAATLAGQIVPILNLARLLDRERGAARYDGSGEIIRLRIPGGSVGIWVDRVERLAHDDPGGIILIDPAVLLVAGLAPPVLASGARAPLGDAADTVLPAAAMAPAESFILVEVAEKPFRLRREAVVELIEAVPWTRVPRAPPGFLGVGVLRGTALPVLSLAALLGLPEPAAPGGFAVTEFREHRALLAVDRVVGLRFDRAPSSGRPADMVAREPSAEEGELIDLATAIPEELRRIVLGFSPIDNAARPGDAAIPDPTTEYLAFSVAGQDFAVPVERVARVVGAQPLIKLPRPANDDAGRLEIVGAIEWRGQIVPVAALQSRLGLARDSGQPSAAAPSAYVILRGADGLGAIGVDRLKQVAALRPGEIAPPPAEEGLIQGIAALGDGELLRIIAPERLWSNG